MVKLIPVISDLQAPLHDARAISAIATFLADRDLDTVSVGDVWDLYQLSKFAQGLHREFEGTIEKQRDVIRKILRDLRVKNLSRSNHDDRLEKYVERRAPGLWGVSALEYPVFLGLDELGCVFHRQPYELTPGWVLVHGDEGTLSQSPGSTAINLVRRFGKSVVCGHTHRMGIQHAHHSSGGRITREQWGFEVGHLMDMRKADYLRAGAGNWQQGFGILVVDGNQVTPVPVPIRGGQFYFDGKVWRG